MIRLVIYLLGLLIITAAIFLGAMAFPDIPFLLAAAVALLVLGLGVLGATYVVPERYTMLTAAARLREKGDPWKGLGEPQRLPELALPA